MRTKNNNVLEFYLYTTTIVFCYLNYFPHDYTVNNNNISIFAVSLRHSVTGANKFHDYHHNLHSGMRGRFFSYDVFRYLKYLKYGIYIYNAVYYLDTLR